MNSRRRIMEITKFAQGTFPTTYLGAPLFVGAPRISYFRYLEEKVSRKIGGWMRNLLSMSRRLALIKSVLNSISIHCMAVFDIPKAVTMRISSVIQNFLWDAGDQRRHHWIAWDVVTKPIEAGGLGIIPLEDIKLSMQGRLAWKYHSEESLWSRFTRQKHSVGNSGAGVWKNIQNLMEHMQDHTSWVFGDGETKVDKVCSSIGVNCPAELSGFSIRTVHEMSDTRNLFRSIMPARFQRQFEDFIPSGSKDRLIWTGNALGCFNTKEFRESYSTKHAKVAWSTIIWQRWIPKRVSCFIWRLCNNGLPTDDNIKKISIPIASICACCGKDEETLEHIFFTGPLAVQTWSFLQSVFSLWRPSNIRGFTRRWIGLNQPTSFVDGLRLSLGCLAAWELWRGRNAWIFDHRRHNVLQAILSWMGSITRLINLPFKDSASNRKRLSMLGIIPPCHDKPISVGIWRPSGIGLTASLAIISRPEGSFGGAIFRNQVGNFIAATVFPILMQGMQGFIYGMECTITYFCMRIGGDILTIQSSNAYLGDILFAKEEELPWESVYNRRRFRSNYSWVHLMRINAALNNASIALASTGISQEYTSINQVPRVVARILDHDRMHVPIVGHRFLCE